MKIKMKIKYTAKILITVIGLMSLVYGQDMDFNRNSFEMLKQGRDLYERSVDDKKLIEPAEEIFHKLHEDSLEFRGRAMVYLGALEAVKGKHAFWPTSKMSHVNKAFEIMESGAAENPDDLESLFVQATIYYNLPFFLSRKDEAKKNFKQIIALLPEKRTNYDEEIINTIINYMLEEVELSPEDRAAVEKIEADFKITPQEKE